LSNKPINILTICGSLRSPSSNELILDTLKQFAPTFVNFTDYKGLAELPHFNPEYDNEKVEESVKYLRQLIQNADGLVICTPEYAFGVPGSLKNSFDWTVSSGDYYNKPVALITASSSGEKAHESLHHTFTAMGAILNDECRMLISHVRTKINKGEVSDIDTLDKLSILINTLLKVIDKSL
jgi:NAD(P)H-dependent FMN reductase